MCQNPVVRSHEKNSLGESDELSYQSPDNESDGDNPEEIVKPPAGTWRTHCKADRFG
jgi:hypothetical protein